MMKQGVTQKLRYLWPPLDSREKDDHSHAGDSVVDAMARNRMMKGMPYRSVDIFLKLQDDV